ncbi:hypothetical protein [Streptomyces sp. NPDC091027]|uniref:hypothetical protein n=1 Tax=Streptomyces sp. NPDC091027 TaxID=3365971 RepID=UPI003804002D
MAMVASMRLGATAQVVWMPWRARVRRRSRGGQACGVALPVPEGAGDVEVGGVRFDGLHARGDVFGEGQELLVQLGRGAGGEVEVGVEDERGRRPPWGGWCGDRNGCLGGGAGPLVVAEDDCRLGLEEGVLGGVEPEPTGSEAEGIGFELPASPGERGGGYLRLRGLLEA